MFKVYWTYGNECHGKEFLSMTDALQQCQDLRNSGRNFVTMCSENPDMVGEYGVTETGPDYDWKKRR